LDGIKEIGLVSYSGFHRVRHAKFGGVAKVAFTRVCTCAESGKGGIQKHTDYARGRGVSVTVDDLLPVLMHDEYMPRSMDRTSMRSSGSVHCRLLTRGRRA